MRTLLSKLKPLNICIVLIAIWGIVMSFMVPTWQSPDETNHIRMIGEEIGVNDMFNMFIEDDYLDFNEIIYNYDRKVDVEKWEDSLTRAPKYSRESVTPKAIHPTVIRHLPQVVGVLIGILMHLPTFWVMTLGELCSLAFYLFIIYRAVKLMPIEKELFLVFATMPMVIHQVASLNYDGTVLPMSFLFIALVFNYRYSKPKIGWRELGLLLGIVLLIAFIKIPYVLLVCFLGLLPKEKIELPIGKYTIDGEVIRKWRIPVIIVGIVIACVAIYVLRDKVYFFRILVDLAKNPIRTIKLYLNTYIAGKRFLFVSFLGDFGWLDAPLPDWFTKLFLLLIAAMSVCIGKKNDIKWTTRGLTWLVVIIMSALIVASMIDFTIEQMIGNNVMTYDEALDVIPYIGGYQGRYFIPFVPFAFLVMPKIGWDPKWKEWIPVGFTTIMMVASLIVIHFRYWA